MKKIILIIFALSTFLWCGMISAGAKTLKEGINELFMENHPGVYEELVRVQEEDSMLEAEFMYNRQAFKDRLTEGYLSACVPDEDNAVLAYYLGPAKYAAQYVENGDIEYLLYGPVWRAQSLYSPDLTWFYMPDTYHKVSSVIFTEHRYTTLENITSRDLIDDEGTAFLKDTETIGEMMKEKGDFIDCKLIKMNRIQTILYLKYTTGEYGILIYQYEEDREMRCPNVEKFKLYSLYDIVNAIGENNIEIANLNQTDYYIYEQTSQVLIEKPTYETEAEALQQAGLLQGNENGLDLLKPLTRAEAVTLLIRAMGLEDQTVNYPVSQFADIASDNWASPYAALAKAEGITNGVSETEFAPDDRVTADQFATFALRAAGESDFDYTQGTQILIDRGIITAEQAETMDLFTRGDMAKIIYEAREKGLL